MLTNCTPCSKELHNECTREDCLCASDDHGENYICDTCKKSGTFEAVHRVCEVDWLANRKVTSCKCPNIGHARNNNQIVIPNERSDAQRLWSLENEGTGGDSPEYVLPEMVKLVIFAEQMVSKIEITARLKPFCKRYHIELDKIDSAIDMVWGDIDIYEQIKEISFLIGSKNVKTKFDRTQLSEAALWISGNNYIKRLELDGKMFYFNGQYYEGNAEELIRRSARQILPKHKTTDITEVVKYIEDTCKLIKWTDIEQSIHIKCLNNGLFDVKRGVFSPNFDPDYIILSQIPQDYDTTKNYDEIDTKVKELIPDNISRQAFYDFLSSCLIPYTGIDYMFGVVGSTGTGKSQLGELAQKIFGEDDNILDSPIHKIASDATTQIEAAFKILNIDDDLSDESIKQIDVIKKWVTQSKFTARGIYDKPTTFRPMSRLMFAANDLFEIPSVDDAEAIYDRTYLIRIDKKYRHQDNEIKNMMLKVATQDQLNGIITYLLHNATWMYENESYHHTIDVKDVENIWNTHGNRIQLFVKKWIVFDAAARTESGDPFNKWSSHAHENSFKPKDKKKFKPIFEEIVGNVPTKTRINGIECYAYSGFRIKTDDEIKQEEQTSLEDSSKSSVDSSIINISKIFLKYNNIIKNTELLELSRSKV